MDKDQKDELTGYIFHDGALDAARKEWFENYGSAIVEKNRYFLLLVISVAIILAMSIGLAFMLPLKKSIPYLVHLSKAGAVIAAHPVYENYVPGIAEKKYFLTQWVSKIMTLSPHLSEKNLASAYEKTVGTASIQFTEFVRKYKPIQKINQSISRSVSIIAATTIEKNVMLIRFKTKTHQKSSESITATYQAILHYKISPPKTEEEIIKNPIGIFITNFDIRQELNP